MARVKRGVTAHKRHKRLLKDAEGRRAHVASSSSRRARRCSTRWPTLPGTASSASASMRGAVDRPPQRRGAPERPHLRRSSSRASRPPASPSIARSWPTSPCAMRRRSRRIAEVAKRRLTAGRAVTPVAAMDPIGPSKTGTLRAQLGARSAAPRVDGRGRRAGPRCRRGRRCWAQEGRPDGHPARHRRPAGRGPAAGRARSPTRSARRVEAALAARRDSLESGAAGGPARRRAVDVDAAGPAALARARCTPSSRRRARSRRSSASSASSSTKGPEVENDDAELPDAQHPARPSRPGPVGHALRRRSGHDRRRPAAPADPHVARPRSASCAPRQPPIRALLPGRCFRYEAVDASHGFEFFQVEGLMVDEGTTMARPAGPARRVRPCDVRRRPSDPLPARLLPVHRAVRRLRRRVRRLRRQRLPRLRPERLDDDPGRGHGPPGRAPQRRHRPRALPGLRLRHGRRADRHAAPRRSATCGSSSRTTCASWSSSDESAAVAGCASTSTSSSTPEQLAERLTLLGMEVKGIERWGADWQRRRRRRAADGRAAPRRRPPVADHASTLGRRRRAAGHRLRRHQHRARPAGARGACPARSCPATAASSARREDGRRQRGHALLRRRAAADDRRRRHPDPARRHAARDRRWPTCSATSSWTWTSSPTAATRCRSSAWPARWRRPPARPLRWPVIEVRGGRRRDRRACSRSTVRGPGLLLAVRRPLGRRRHGRPVAGRGSRCGCSRPAMRPISNVVDASELRDARAGQAHPHLRRARAGPRAATIDRAPGAAPASGSRRWTT